MGFIGFCVAVFLSLLGFVGCCCSFLDFVGFWWVSLLDFFAPPLLGCAGCRCILSDPLFDLVGTRFTLLDFVGPWCGILVEFVGNEFVFLYSRVFCYSPHPNPSALWVIGAPAIDDVII